MFIYISEFTRFPTDEKIKLQWVRNMGRINWMPKYYSSLCSEHFSKECIDFRDKLPRLRKGSIPTIFNHEKENVSPPLQEFSELEHINHLNKRMILHIYITTIILYYCYYYII